MGCAQKVWPSDRKKIVDAPKYSSVSNILWGDLLLGAGKRIFAYHTKNNKMVFSVPIQIRSEGKFAEPLNQYLVILGKSMNSEGSTLYIISKYGKLVNSIPFSKSARSPGENQGPFVTRHFVYAAAGNTVYRFPKKDILVKGTKADWVKTFPGREVSLSVDNQDWMFIGDQSGQLEAIDQNGQTKWTYTRNTQDFMGWIMASHLAQEKLIVHTSDGRMMSLDKQTGQSLWNKYSSIEVCDGGAGFTRYAAIQDELIYIAPFGDSCVIAFDIQKGHNVWIYKPPQDFRWSFSTKPIYVNGVVYASNGKLWALDGKTGQVLDGLDNLNGKLHKSFGIPLVYHPKMHRIYYWNRAMRIINPIR